MSRLNKQHWDGVTPLRELFELSGISGQVVASTDTPPIIDQRFIDYLNAQPRDISRMHWRQFELLVGEFFRRNGYEIRVTPPTRDGGIDVHAVRDTNLLGPELVLVQAKRFRDHREVCVESVKALWSDLDELRASRAVIATTPMLSEGARAFCEARHYRLTAVERPTVESWLRSLATYAR
jgi:HJR/Mrr/RecB family endonuclease